MHHFLYKDKVHEGTIPLDGKMLHDLAKVGLIEPRKLCRVHSRILDPRAVVSFTCGSLYLVPLASKFSTSLTRLTRNSSQVSQTWLPN
jgi:hypothetical protein